MPTSHQWLIKDRGITAFSSGSYKSYVLCACFDISVKHKKYMLYIGHSSPIYPFLSSLQNNFPTRCPAPPSARSDLQQGYPSSFQQNLKASSRIIQYPPCSIPLLIQGVSSKSLRNYGGGLPNPLQATPMESSTSLIWRPSALLSLRRSSHPLDTACTAQELATLMRYCSREATTTFVRHHIKEDVHVTTTDLRDLLSHTRPIADETITLYLELLATQYNITYLATNTLPKLWSEGWATVQRSFANYRNRARSHTRPLIEGEPAIILPCYVHGCHWVSVVRREILGQVYFLFADDLNNTSTEEEIKQLLSTANTCLSFHPPSAQWISCTNYTYIPHSNECRPRSLIAATIMALHQHPSDLILLPAMHPNLAQIARTWVAKSLLINQIDNSALLPLLAPHNLEPSPTLNMHSHPYHLVPWSARGSTASPINHSISKSCTNKDILVVDSKTIPKKLNPQAPAFIPKDTMTKRHINTLSNTTCNQS
jgi:hypothetical protein